MFHVILKAKQFFSRQKCIISVDFFPLNSTSINAIFLRDLRTDRQIAHSMQEWSIVPKIYVANVSLSHWMSEKYHINFERSSFFKFWIFKTFFNNLFF